jgi:pectate lyase
MFRKILIGAAVSFAVSGAHAATDYPSGYTKCAQVGSTCTMSGTHKVALGKSGSFVYATLTGSFTCSTSLFPSNSFTSSAWCSYDPASASSSSSSSSSSKSSSSAATSSTSSSKASSSAATSSASSSKASSSSSSTSTAGSASCVAGAVLDGVSVDCGGKTIGTSCLSDNEGQAAVISLKNGATLSNVHIKSGAGGHGISCLAGNCTLKNVTWDEVCEHAAGNYSEGGTFSIYDSTATQILDNAYEHGNKPDKFFQDNAFNAKMYVRNFTAIMQASTLSKDSQGNSVTTYTNSGKILRTCGDCSANKGGRSLDLDGLTVKHVDASGARVSGPGLDSIVGINTKWDSTVPSEFAIPDKAILRNLKIQDYKLSSDGVKSTPKVCVPYIGSRTHNGSSSMTQEWNTSSCDVKTSDVTAF